MAGDQEKTQKIFEDNGLLDQFEAPMDLLKMRKWKQQVTTEEGNFRQHPDHPNIKYPIKEPTQIIRNKLLNERGRETLTTIESWYGVDGNNNIRKIDVNSLQYFDSPVIETLSRQSETDSGVTEKYKKVTGMTKRFTEDFTKEGAEEAYNRSDKTTISLLIKERGKGRKPMVVDDFEDFVSKDFNELLTGKPVIKKEVKRTSTMKREVEQLAS